jgi:hypothetical protein
VEELEAVIELMDEVISDRAVPRNIRKIVEEAKNKLLEKSEKLNLNISSAIYLLDDISNDINMPSHTRTEIWNIISNLEAIREKIK